MTRTEMNIIECSNGEDFDWKGYQYLCDIADYWDCED